MKMRIFGLGDFASSGTAPCSVDGLIRPLVASAADVATNFLLLNISCPSAYHLLDIEAYDLLESGLPAFHTKAIVRASIYGLPRRYVAL